MPENFHELFNRYLQGQISPDELKQLKHFIQDEKNTETLNELLKEAYGNPKLRINDNSQDEAWAEFRQRIDGQGRPGGRLRYLRSGWFRAAAVIAALAAVAAIWLVTDNGKKKNEQAAQTPVQQDMSPGRQGALLTLADGRVISLDSLNNGLVADAGGVAVNLSDGSLSYEKDDNAEATFNTLSTPKGRQFRLVLPDGSKVWLNAASSIRYPTRFAGKERKVELSGEVYIEVARNSAQPFIATNGNIDMTVLGTSFNAKLYENEANAITLVTGKLQVEDRGGQDRLVLDPGTQALMEKGKIRLHSNPDLNHVLAWKEGKFSFSNAGIEDVMNELARWYDISVKYEGNIPQRKFTGKIGMDLRLSEVLELLRKNDIRFGLQDRILYVKEK